MKLRPERSTPFPLNPLSAILTIAALGATTPCPAQLTVRIPATTVREGAPATTIDIELFATGSITDMVARLEAFPAGDATGDPPPPQITAVSFDASVWSTAPGGFISFFSGATPPATFTEPNASLLTGGESVAGSGRLFSFTVDPADLPPGTYPLALTGTRAGDTRLLLRGTTLPTTFVNGSLRILRALDAWRIEHFGQDVENPFLQQSLWGHTANPDGDLLDNLAEFCYGTDPLEPSFADASTDTGGLPSATPVAAGGNRAFDLTFARPRLATGLSITFETSTDNSRWLPVASPPQTIATSPIGDGFHQLVTVRIPATDTALLFCRIRLEHEEP